MIVFLFEKHKKNLKNKTKILTNRTEVTSCELQLLQVNFNSTALKTFVLVSWEEGQHELYGL